MSEISGQTSLAIVEKKPQRPGGCAGIFFQLFEWNKKLAKKKLFSKKLLPPVRLRKSSKKFEGDEKMPKLRLITDENSGGFPHVKKNEGGYNGGTAPKNEMRAPGLVARLMGLESMPTVKQDKSTKALLSRSGSNGEEFVFNHGRSVSPELIEEKGEIKQEFRPQKLQKTGLSERKPVTRFGAEALQIKNMLSISKKNHQKLACPVKSPRNASGRNASRLIGAATRILEPRLQRSKLKSALTYSHAVDHQHISDGLLVGANDLEAFQKARHIQTSAKPLRMQSSSCTNCGHVDVGLHTEEQPSVLSSLSQFMNPPSQMSKRDSQRPSLVCHKLEKRKTEEDSQLYAALAVEERQPCASYMPEIKLLKSAGQRNWQAPSAECRLQKDESPAYLRHKTQGQDQMFQMRDRIPSRSNLRRLQSNRISAAAANATNETKDFVLLKQNNNDHSHLRMPLKEDTHRFDADRRCSHREHDSLSPMRKRRSLNSPMQNEGSSYVSSTFAKPTSMRSSTFPGKGVSLTSHPTIGPSTNRLAHMQGSMSADSSKNDSDAISLTFKSSMKRKTGIHASLDRRRNPSCPNLEVGVSKSVLNESEGKRNFLRSFPLSGDSLGALLEQKLKELTYQEDSAPGDATPRKTTAVILQELISALTPERPCHRDQLVYGVDHRDSYVCCDDQQLGEHTPTTVQAKPKSTRISVGCLPNGEHLSPGSVLDASFSNDSCASSSVDDGSRCCEGQRQLEPYADLFCSASSLSKFYRDSVANLLNNIYEVFRSINLAESHLKGSKLTHAKEVILNAELVFGNAALPDAVVNGGFSISKLVLNELEMLASVMWTNFSGFAAFDTKDGNQLRSFVFDCVIEYLESRFSQYANSGFNAWTRLPLRMKTEMMICEIVKEVGRWAELAGLMIDELVDHEMSQSLGKWTDFELEAFETGTEIDQQILQSLITEVVLDFIGSSASQGC